MRIIIIDDDRLVATSLRAILEAEDEIDVAGVGSCGADAIALAASLHPDVVLMDIRMQEMSGLAAAERILEMDKAAKILFLTTFSDDEYIVRAIRIGAKGYLLKQDFASIAPALRAVGAGQNVFGGQITNRLSDLMLGKKQTDIKALGVCEREWEIAGLVAEGLSNREIAEKLYLSDGTVRNYISSILEKLNLRDRTQLAVFYLKNT